MTLLIVEPFYGGSHKHLIDMLSSHYSGVRSTVSPACEVFTLPAKKWHWRARTAALFFAQTIPRRHSYTTLFCSSVLNLAELVALRPDLQQLKRIIYFHENQLVYPVRKQQTRDFQFGYNQILSCLVSDVALFNSRFNRDSFLNNIDSFLRTMPDFRPQGIRDQLLPKCHVLYFPMQFVDVDQLDHRTHSQQPLERRGYTDDCSLHTDITDRATDDSDEGHQSSVVSLVSETDSLVSLPASVPDKTHCEPLHIVWPHRWEHDKNPEALFTVLFALHDDAVSFKLSVLGQTFTDVPPVFTEAKQRLASHIVNYGFVESRDDYQRILSSADVVVSTARHEFFGVAMLEAVCAGCYPLCPRRLVYPEIFPDECLYNTEKQLLKRLRTYCRNPTAVRSRQLQMDLTKFSWKRLSAEYERYIELPVQT